MKYLYFTIALLPLLFSFGCGSGDTQTTGNPVMQGMTGAKIVDWMAAENTLESRHLGFAGVESAQWARYEMLKSLASEDELCMLTKHPNAVVRSYAFQALASTHSPQTFPILLEHLKDSASMETHAGCFQFNTLVGDYFIDVVTSHSIESGTYQLTPPQKQMLDSILLFSDSLVLRSQDLVYTHTKPAPENYHRIRYLVTEKRNGFALCTLGKYQKKEDRELICSFLDDVKNQWAALSAIREFPDDYFYTDIMRVFDAERERNHASYSVWRVLYQVLAQHPGPETLDRFEQTLNITDEHHYQTHCSFLLLAITKYPDPVFEVLKKRIKLDEFHLNEVKEELEEGL